MASTSANCSSHWRTGSRAAGLMRPRRLSPLAGATRSTSGERGWRTIEWLIGVFAAVSGQQRSAALARLDTGRVRTLARDHAPLAACRSVRLQLLAQPLALVLGDAAAPGLRRGRDTTSGSTGLR